MRRIEIMKRSTFVKSRNGMILKFDLSNLKTADEVGKVVDYFVSIVERMPKRSMNILVNLSNLIVSDRLSKELIRLAKKCNPYMISTAIVVWDFSTKAFANLLLEQVENINMKVFNGINEAEGWLGAQ